METPIKILVKTLLVFNELGSEKPSIAILIEGSDELNIANVLASCIDGRDERALKYRVIDILSFINIKTYNIDGDRTIEVVQNDDIAYMMSMQDMSSIKKYHAMFSINEHPNNIISIQFKSMHSGVNFIVDPEALRETFRDVVGVDYSEICYI